MSVFAKLPLPLNVSVAQPKDVRRTREFPENHGKIHLQAVNLRALSPWEMKDVLNYLLSVELFFGAS